jgi:hypothetical protein
MKSYNPDGTRTRAEHARNLMLRVADYVGKGHSLEDAIARAGKDWREYLEGEGRRKIEHAKRMLGIKP